MRQFDERRTWLISQKKQHMGKNKLLSVITQKRDMSTVSVLFRLVSVMF